MYFAILICLLFPTVLDGKKVGKINDILQKIGQLVTNQKKLKTDFLDKDDKRKLTEINCNEK